MTHEEAMKLAEEVFDEEYSGLDKDSFLIGFQEAYNALTTLYKDNFELVKKMRDTQQDIEMMERFAYKWTVDDHFKYDVLLKDKSRLEEKVDEYLKKMEE